MIEKLLQILVVEETIEVIIALAVVILLGCIYASVLKECNKDLNSKP